MYAIFLITHPIEDSSSDQEFNPFDFYNQQAMEGGQQNDDIIADEIDEGYIKRMLFKYAKDGG